MNLVSNFIGSISPEMFNTNAQGLIQGIDLGDTTFSDLLEKQLNNAQNNNPNTIQSIGFPSGVNNIVDIDGGFLQGVNFRGNKEVQNDMLESVKPINESESSVFKDVKNMSTSEVVTFFNSLFDSKPKITDTSQSELYEFEKKIAAGKYGKYAKNVITDLSEFVTDTIRMKTVD